MLVSIVCGKKGKYLAGNYCLQPTAKGSLSAQFFSIEAILGKEGSPRLQFILIYRK